MQFEAGLVTTKIIAAQLALPALREVASMLTGVAGAEVVNDCRCIAELADLAGRLRTSFQLDASIAI